MSCKAFLIKMVKKLVDKSPLTYPLVRYMNFLDPRIFIAKKETSAEKLTCILRIMSEAGRISDNECDKVMLQFNHFHDNSLTADSEAFKGFSMETGRVDNFYLISCLTRLISRTFGKLSSYSWLSLMDKLLCNVASPPTTKSWLRILLNIH